MRFWDSEHEKMNAQRSAFRDFRPRPRTASGAAPTSAVASSGSVRPFLRRFYHNQVAVSAPVRRFLVFVLLAGIVYAFVLGDGGVIRIAMLQHERATLDHRINELEHNATVLEAEVARLDSDPFYVEKTGRERYSYIKPGDKVFKIVEPAKDARKSK
ncbi:MAG TPA: septum formation initiator family protein [Candidatus Krumholzibacteria bacterium]|nr:septum formation initiator family protein [Candidatus Krumholzibacteria bacterium]